MTWIKICGMTNLEDALTAVEAGADAVGFVFYEKSPRNISVEAAREIVEKLPEGVEKVGVFVGDDDGNGVMRSLRSGANRIAQTYRRFQLRGLESSSRRSISKRRHRFRVMLRCRRSQLSDGESEDPNVFAGFG